MKQGRASFRLTEWGGLVNVAAVLEALLLLAVGALISDLETIAFGVVVAATTVLVLYRRSRLALLVRLAVFADVEFWMGTAVAANLGSSGRIEAPLALAVVSGIGLVASVAAFLHLGNGGGRVPLAFAAIGVLVFGASYPFVSRPTAGFQTSGPASLTIKNARYSSTNLHLKAGPGGAADLEVTNEDLFWHTFTSPEMGFDERLASGAHHVVRVNISRGVYQFYCAIPGHAQIGMRGTLTVE